jgi:hypothetical protein
MREFIGKMLCNDQGQPSANRVILCFLMLAVISWENLIVCATMKFADVPQGILWLVGIFSGVIVTSYAKTAFIAGKEADNGCAGTAQ